MSENQNLDRNRRNPWKIASLTGGGIFLAVAAAVALANVMEQDDAVVVASAGEPPRQIVEDCNRYAADAARDTGKVVKDGVFGTAIGAGLGAAGGAIVDGGKGAGKGAGIGALAGAAAGTLYGLNEENRRTESARSAYSACMARRGY